MCKGIAVVMITFLSTVAQAQTRQIKLYLQQIAANKVYIEYAWKGYTIAKSGLQTIGNIKDGHFRLDSDFFTSLSTVSPAVRGYARVAEIGTLAARITTTRREVWRDVSASTLFTPHEKVYFDTVLTRLVRRSGQVVDAVMNVVLTGKLQMSDDERLRRIDELHVAIVEQYSFSKRFAADIRLLLLQKTRAQKDVERLRQWHGLKG